jgi:hypothetical protein
MSWVVAAIESPGKMLHDSIVGFDCLTMRLFGSSLVLAACPESGELLVGVIENDVIVLG